MHSEDDDYNLPITFQQRRHEQRTELVLADLMKNWRLKSQKVRLSLLVYRSVDNFSFLQMKTVSVALVLCLNVGVDPPDLVKTDPCARLECWFGKFSF